MRGLTVNKFYYYYLVGMVFVLLYDLLTNFMISITYIATISWTSASSSYSQYLQIDLLTIKNITGIATKGRSSPSEFVKEYTISFSTNLYDYSVYKENDGSSKVVNFFSFFVAY
jgi:hypothetical protein